MKHTDLIPLAWSVPLAIALVATPALAQDETPLPRLLILSGEAENTLPGDAEGAEHGVVVRRGSGFPEPAVIEEPEPEEVVRPEPPTRRVTIRRRSRWGY